MPANFSTSSAADYKVNGDFSVTCNSIKQSSLTGAWTVTAPGLNFVATSSVSFTGLPYAATCMISGDVIATRGIVSSNNLPVTATFTTAQAPLAWWPPTFIPQGVKNYLDATQATPGSVVNATFPGQTQSGLLPPACRITGDDCWKEAVRNGTIKFVSTTAVDQVQPTRPIAFCFYKTVDTIFFPNLRTTFYCIKPFFADDGTLVNVAEKVEGSCSPWEKIFHVSNTLGEIWQEKNPETGVSACYQKRFILNSDKVSGGWTNIETPCP